MPRQDSDAQRDLARRLSGDGLVLPVHPFTFKVQSRLPVVAQGIHALYGSVLEEGSSRPFADFHVAVQPRWQGYKRVCQFSVDGFQPFSPLAVGEGFALLEWGMNWCVTGFAHHWILIHAAVLERNGFAVLLPAPPGSGKSTLCTALMLNGWRLLSDEMALLDPASGLVTPFPRPISLKNHSIALAKSWAPNAVMGPVAVDTIKGTVAHMRASDESLRRWAECVPPAWVVFPKYEAGAALTVNAKTKPQAVVELASNSFNQHVHGKPGFDALVRLVDQSACYEFKYSALDDAISWFAELDVPTC